MIDPKMLLTVKFDTGGFVDFTQKAADFTRDEFSSTLLAGEYLYLGYTKPFGSSFIKLETPNTNPAVMSIEIFDGTSWVAPDSFQDESDGLTRDGFLFWDKTSMTETIIDSNSKFYARMKLDVDSSAMTFRGIGVLFSDDSRLRANFPPINSTSFYPDGEDSHVLSHQASRDEIILRLRKRYQKRNTSLDVNIKINAFDIIDIFEIREAATYLCLAKIFFNIFDNEEDQWYKKYKHWKGKYEAAFEVAYLGMDLDDDGVDGDEEIQKPKESASMYR